LGEVSFTGEIFTYGFGASDSIDINTGNLLPAECRPPETQYFPAIGWQNAPVSYCIMLGIYVDGTIRVFQRGNTITATVGDKLTLRFDSIKYKL
jgi:hypothetical protein